MAGNAVVPHLLNDCGAEYDAVLCLSRNVDASTFASRTTRPYVPVASNLNDRDELVESLRATGSPEVTDVYWFAEANRPLELGDARVLRGLLALTDSLSPAIHGMLKVSPKIVLDQVYGLQARLAGSGVNARNQLWMGNVLDALKEIGAPLQVFVLGTGGKHYGMHLGPTLWPRYSSPFYEDSTHGPGPLSYFDAQSFVRKRAAADGFTWNEVRPSFILGLPPELNPKTQSFGIALATYASVLKAQGRKLMFPGPQSSYHAMNNLSTSEKIAEVAAWSTAHPNQAFNCPSCPPFSWSQAWEGIAEWFGMEPADPAHDVLGDASESLAGPDAAQTWQRMQSAHSLAGHDLGALLNYSFLDKSFMVGHDAVYDTTKLEKFGFSQDRVYEYRSGEECVIAFFERLVEERVIPHPSDVVPESQPTSGRR
jgi:hypothetical protein